MREPQKMLVKHGDSFKNPFGLRAIKAIAARKPMRTVFRDEGYGDDSSRINVERLFKLLSAGTELKSL